MKTLKIYKQVDNKDFFMANFDGEEALNLATSGSLSDAVNEALNIWGVGINNVIIETPEYHIVDFSEIGREMMIEFFKNNAKDFDRYDINAALDEALNCLCSDSADRHYELSGVETKTGNPAYLSSIDLGYEMFIHEETIY